MESKKKKSSKKSKKEKAPRTTFVYLLKLSSKEGAEHLERMYKVGHAKNVKGRIKQISQSYDVEVIETLELPHEEALRLEGTLKFEWSKWRYWPKIKFPGHTEVLKNKVFLSIGPVLQPNYDAINTDKIRVQYYIDKAARSKESKRRYWANKGRKINNNSW